MELDKTEFQLGKNITVRLFLKNIGSEPVEIAFPQWWYANGRHLIRLIVTDEDDSAVCIHPVITMLSVYDLVLGPGEQRIETYEWMPFYNQDPYYGQSFKPGTYKIRGQTMTYAIPGRTLPEGHRLETPPIIVTIS